MPKWLQDAVFYEIYPQSFQDSNGDGIGDFEGIIDRLDYIRDLGCNALWINPCFDSPFWAAMPSGSIPASILPLRMPAMMSGTIRRRQSATGPMKIWCASSGKPMPGGSMSFWIWCRAIPRRSTPGSWKAGDRK